LIFAWHGHGGSMRNASRWDYEKYWPEAIVVYPQGLPTKGMTDPQGTKAGWQQKVGDYEDRDLKFFDAMLAELKKDYPVDDKRIFSTGHSNGGKMTYLLWEARGKEFAAFPVGCPSRNHDPVVRPQAPVPHRLTRGPHREVHLAESLHRRSHQARRLRPHLHQVGGRV
jgi:poly(3-hydroxybutyrate) depolymerase